MIALRRMAYPNRFDDLVRDFQRSASALSDEGPRLAAFARAVSNQNAPLGVCWGFIDGTARPICRPTRNQRLYYSGHKRYHALKFQRVLTPDGMIAQLYGPVEGRRHDMFLVRDSGIRIKSRIL